MILVVDVGNAEILLGVYDKENLISGWEMTTNVANTSDEIGTTILRFLKLEGIQKEKIKDVIVSSVVPTIIYSLNRAINKYFCIEPIYVTHNMETGINLGMANPKELGSDRLAKMVAAFEIYGGPIMVVDYATGTTFDVVDGNGNFVTAITAPGVHVCAESLFSKTAQLPKIEIKKPDSIYCRDIVSCIQGGIYYGHIGEAKYIVNMVKKETGYTNLKVVATGGMAKAIDDKGEIFDVLDPFLTFKGLRLLYEKNKDNYPYRRSFDNGSCN